MILCEPDSGDQHLEQHVAVLLDVELLEDLPKLLIELGVTRPRHAGARSHSHHSSESLASIERTLSRVHARHIRCTPRASLSNDQPAGSSLSSSADMPHREHTSRSRLSDIESDATAR